MPHVNGRHNLEGMLAQIDENTSIVWLCSPNNPTGEYIREDELIPFLDKVPDDVLVVFDAAYYEYVAADDYPALIPLISRYKNVIILHTFSKIYGIASLRVGYGIADETIIRMLEPTREPFNVNSVAQRAAIEAISDQSFIEECKQRNREGLQAFYQFCEKHQLSYYPSQGNFILMDTGYKGNEVFHYLLERGVIVRSGEALGFPTSIRVTVGSEEENTLVLKELEGFLQARMSETAK